MDPQLQQILQTMAQSISDTNAAIAQLATASQGQATSTTTATAETSTSLFDKLINRIEKFEYDPEANQTFNRWFGRYSEFIKVEGLCESEKRRLALSKLASKQYNLYTQGLLPKTFNDLDFQETIDHEDLWNKLQGNSIFSQIDLKDAYLQIELDEASKQLVVIKTHRGIFQYQRLPFGVSPGIFQKLMDQHTAGLSNTAVYLDDIIVASPNSSSHIKALRALFSWINGYGLRARLDKCHFNQTTQVFRPNRRRKWNQT
jgi:hypothetical protein